MLRALYTGGEMCWRLAGDLALDVRELKGKYDCAEGSVWTQPLKTPKRGLRLYRDWDGFLFWFCSRF